MRACCAQSRGPMMHENREVEISFSASAEEVIRSFMKVAVRTMPQAALIPLIEWYISGTFTDRATGEVRTLGPGIDVGAIDPMKLTDELIVPMGSLKVAIRLPEELRSAKRLNFDFVDNSFVIAKN